MSLQWLIEKKAGLFRGPATVGIIKGETGWILIDTGVDADVPKKVVKALVADTGQADLKISAVINTHSHADHCGGNRWLIDKHQAKVYASSGERPYIEAPHLEPHYLFSAEAPKALKNKFFQAEASQVDEVVRFSTGAPGEEVAFEADGVALKAVNLKGHSMEMMGIVTEDRLFYCGDLLFAPTILDKHPLLFLHDFEAYRASAAWCAAQDFEGAILTHGGYFEDHRPLAEAAIARLEHNCEVILNAVDAPVDEWTVHHRVAKQFELEENFGGWHLNHGVIRSYLGYGLKTGRIAWDDGLYRPTGSETR